MRLRNKPRCAIQKFLAENFPNYRYFHTITNINTNTISLSILLPILLLLFINTSCSQKNSRFPKVAWSKADQSFATRCLISCPPNKLAFILQISQNDIMASKHFFWTQKKIAKEHTHILFGEVLLRVKTLLYNYISSKKGHLQEKGEAPPAARPREVSVEWPGGALAQKVGKSLKEDQEVSKIYQL